MSKRKAQVNTPLGATVYQKLPSMKAFHTQHSKNGLPAVFVRWTLHDFGAHLLWTNIWSRGVLGLALSLANAKAKATPTTDRKRDDKLTILANCLTNCVIHNLTDLIRLIEYQDGH